MWRKEMDPRARLCLLLARPNAVNVHGCPDWLVRLVALLAVFHILIISGILRAYAGWLTGGSAI
jgi:hypothetical protein